MHMQEEKLKILYVEDDEVDRLAFERVVKKEKLPYDYVIVETLEEADRLLDSGGYDVIVSDFMLPDGMALDLLKEHTDTPVIIVTGQGDEETAVRAMKMGAYDYLIKDPDGNYLALLPQTVSKTVERKNTEEELKRYKQDLEALVEARTEELRKSEERYDLAVRGSANGLWDWPDISKDEEWWAPRVYELIGYRPDEIESSIAKFRTLMHPDDRARIKEALEAHLKEKKPYDIEYRLRTKSGEYRWVHARGQALWSKKGEALRMAGSIQDITDRKYAEDTLREYDRMITTLMGNLPGIAYRCRNDKKWTMQFLSEGSRRLLGHDPGDLIDNRKTSYADIIHPDDRERIWKETQKAVREKKPFRLEYRVNTASGEEKWIWEQGTAVFSEDDTLLFLEGFITDITDRKKAESAALKLARFPEENPNPVLRVAADGTFLYSNPAAANLMTLWGGPDHFVIPEEWLISVKQALDLRREVRSEIQVAGTVYVLVFAPVHEMNFVNVYAMDITDRVNAEKERERLEEQLLQSRKLESIGRLAGGIAHDFNNILTGIIMYTDLLKQSKELDGGTIESIDEIQKAAYRAASLTQQLLAFSRKQMLQPKVIDLNGLVRELDKMLRRVIGENIDLLTKLDSGLPPVMADPGQIEQVLTNLVVNARDAMPDGGKLTIETGNVLLDGRYASQHAEVAPGRYVMLAVSDNGVGMKEETKKNIFEPFFTTKKTGEGTGLGLSTVYGIVKQSGGHIFVYSEPGVGTTFKIYLPAVAGGGIKARSEDKPFREQKREETVLFVEDDEFVRDTVMTILKKQGYTVITAGSGEEALSVYREHKGGPIRLLITDVVMPGMSGKKLAQALSGENPKMKVLFISGYTDNAIVHHGVLDEGVSFLQKPFSKETLLKKLDEIL
ncbi:MAG: PAS domain-containing protein [Spirochaetes bacterium]|nr:PAS domain-containing protein [Spirochaetota bacterium]